MTTTRRARHGARVTDRTGAGDGRRALCARPAARRLAALTLALSAALAALAPLDATAAAEESEAEATQTVSAIRVGEDGAGPITGLPMPRYVSLKATKANVRRGPGMTHRVDWVFVRQGMPLEVIAEYGHWRRVRDPEGASGWLHYSMIRGNRTALVTAETTDLRLEPTPGAAVSARAERGVVFEIEACQRDWCEVEKDGVDGWAAKADLWGVGPEEVFD
ncbi:SH3 domain-containing protein [uncultured Albimonas sp.]|uniref:SH3 domain-containing protein n=1 Tax=uncultured Albimonas sp. TaxID=1331701 RepID=UPI0030EBE2A8|tara:strand:+ start:2820 stop:3479 length:660 start_codon:yes stop_codon:yes gene_type:complete